LTVFTVETAAGPTAEPIATELIRRAAAAATRVLAIVD
jgi:hypothetical protein